MNYKIYLDLILIIYKMTHHSKQNFRKLLEFRICRKIDLLLNIILQILIYIFKIYNKIRRALIKWKI